VRRLAALLAVGALAGCGGGGDAHRVLSRTADSLGKIRSGNLTLRLVVSPRSGTRGRVGFVLRGPFSVRAGALPVARIAYTQIAGAHEATLTFLSTGSDAYAAVHGRAYRLPASAEAELRGAVGGRGKPVRPAAHDRVRIRAGREERERRLVRSCDLRIGDARDRKSAGSDRERAAEHEADPAARPRPG